MPDAAGTSTPERPEVGSVFISNYPPYSTWSAAAVPEALEALSSPPLPGATLGLYLHIPFCRKRCKFCYFKVYTEMDSAQVRSYLSALGAEVELLARQQAIGGRPLRFVYFGGGTPSFISARDLKSLVARVQAAMPWTGAEEITFECEPGTLTQAKLEAIREIGVTRLSLGVENFDDAILKENGRAHLSEEIHRVIPWIRTLSFDQLNIDLIAGMVGETWDTWRETVQRTLDANPDSVTVYQMELPFNTVYSQDLLGGQRELPVAGWDLKRAWHDYVFEKLEAAGYVISSAYTMVRKDKLSRFVYRDAVWHGSDMVGTGVASFSHVSGVHYQNASDWGEYIGRVGGSDLPIARALTTTPAQRLVRELILQMKLGRIEASYFQGKFGVDILEKFSAPFERLSRMGMLRVGTQGVELTRQGLLQVDFLLPEFYAPEHRNARYT
ncbi:MAG TPA: coproporphyrinogen-III oxidase family protein [Patescibacteria group bacterium]|nr:coproporphyrinogen-III oxidase family protein [Patescibacteria group bacterium]